MERLTYEVGLNYCETVHKAAETIKLLWELSKEAYEAKYQMQFDKEIGEKS